MPDKKEIKQIARKEGVSQKEASRRVFGHLQKLKEQGKKTK